MAADWRQLTGAPAAGFVLLAFYALLLASWRDKSATFDEPGHATAGYVYWKFGDYRIDPENGNLAKRWLALPFLFRSDRFPGPTAQGWRDAHSWWLSDSWFHRQGNDPVAMLAAGRAMSGLVAVALGAVVWFWSRRLFGPTGGIVSLLIFALSPTMLANGGLMTSDTPAALGFLAATGCVWALLHRVTWPRVIGGTLAIAGLFLAKMSAPLLLPVAMLLVAARLLRRAPLPFGSRLIVRRHHQALALAGVAAIQTVGVVALVWAAYGFRFSAFSPAVPAPPRFQQPWQWALGCPPPRLALSRVSLDANQRTSLDRMLTEADGVPREWSHGVIAEIDAFRTQVPPAVAADLGRAIEAPPGGWIPGLIFAAREHRLLPESFLYGYAHVWRTSGRLAAFFNGEIDDEGWRTFFPFTFAVKTPLALLALLALAGWLAFALTAREARNAGWGRAVAHVVYPVTPLLALMLIYWSAAITSNLNIGHRHLLPIYPPLFVLAGATAWFFRSRGPDRVEPTMPAAISAAGGGPTPRAVIATLTGKARSPLRFVVIALLAALTLETALRFPNYLAYFNGLVTPSKAHRHLIDSSLDWGQELPAIARYLAARPGEPAYLAFFGVGRPAHYGIQARHLGGFPAFDAKLFPPLKPIEGASGDELAAFLRDHPQYDPSLVFRLDGGAQPAVLMTQRSEWLRLGAGLYVISASMLQPVYCGGAGRYWNAEYESHYQSLRRLVRPFQSEDREARIAAVSARPLTAWLGLFDDFFDYRLARLTAYLRERQPDDQINHAVLVYRLTEADLQAALDGPPPPR